MNNNSNKLSYCFTTTTFICRVCNICETGEIGLLSFTQPTNIISFHSLNIQRERERENGLLGL